MNFGHSFWYIGDLPHIETWPESGSRRLCPQQSQTGSAMLKLHRGGGIAWCKSTIFSPPRWATHWCFSRCSANVSDACLLFWVPSPWCFDFQNLGLHWITMDQPSMGCTCKTGARNPSSRKQETQLSEKNQGAVISTQARLVLSRVLLWLHVEFE